jgi:isopropylmalate/homocitrate/citramalate synthase
MTSRPRVPPASAPPIKRTRSAEHLRWEKLWHELKDEALIDLKKTKVELATSKATVQRQNSIISQQTSTITELVETMKRARSKGAAALVDLADFVEKRSPALVASIARAVASRLGTEDPGAARS